MPTPSLTGAGPRMIVDPVRVRPAGIAVDTRQAGTVLPVPGPHRRLPTPDHVSAAVREILGSPPVQWTPVVEGGYSPVARWVVGTECGRAAFVKAALGSAAEPWLHSEARVYAEVSAPWLPELFGYRPGDDDVASVLVIEDLSMARWGIPVDVHDAELLRDALLALTDVGALAGLPPVEGRRQWEIFAKDPRAVIASGLVDDAWLTRGLPDLVAAESAVDLAGGGLVHGDLFLQNWCRADRGAVIVDWAHPWRGNGDLCVAWGEAGVRAAGGPAGVVLPPGSASWAAYVAGQIVWFLLDHDGPVHPRLAETERREAFASLCWAADELDLARPQPAPGFLPNGPWRP